MNGHPPAAAARLPAIDALRGMAIVAMIAYHFAFDLRWFRLTHSDFDRDPFWLAARTAIVASFLLIVGISLVLADRAGTSFGAFLRRIGVVAACAAVVSVASYVVSPQSWIHFGILHCIAVASLVAWPLRRHPIAAFALGAVVIAGGLALAHPVFDPRYGSWLGFTTAKPPTEDYVPLAPWAGVVFAGIAAGHVLARHSFAPLAPLAHLPALLRWLGRHSLAVYMLHQPLMIGILWVVLRLR